MPEFICDFCSATIQAGWNWPARSFLVGPGAESREDWAACNTCHALLLADDWEGLARRTAETFHQHHPEQALIFSREDVYQSARPMHSSFRQNRIGEPVAWTRGATEMPKGITLTCVSCSRPRSVTATAGQISAWRAGQVIQDAMPNVPAGEREMFQSGLCPECWNMIFK